MQEDTQSQMIPVQVDAIRRLPAKGDVPARHFVLLKEIDGERLLPIWIGRTEAEAMAWHLEKVQPPRPMTYELAANLFLAAGGRLREVRINKLDTQSTFFAVAVVEAADGRHEVDARPSDALNLALILGAPVSVDTEIMAQASTHQTRWFAQGTVGTAEIAQNMVNHWNEQPRATTNEPDSPSAP